MKTIWSPGAESDLDAIWQYIAADNVDAADRVVIKVHSALELVADHPNLGRSGRSRRTRELVIPGTPYLVVYRIGRAQIDVLYVIHGAQDWPAKRKRRP